MKQSFLNVLYLEASKTHENCVVMGTSGHIFLVDVEKSSILEQAAAKAAEHTVYYSQA